MDRKISLLTISYVLHGITMMRLPATCSGNPGGLWGEAGEALESACDTPRYLPKDHSGPIRFPDSFLPNFFYILNHPFLPPRHFFRHFPFILVKGKQSLNFPGTNIPENPDRIPGAGKPGDPENRTSRIRSWVECG
jgi:hypothetical protein